MIWDGLWFGWYLITPLAMFTTWFVVTLNRDEAKWDAGDEWDHSTALQRDPPRTEDTPPPWTGPPPTVIGRPSDPLHHAHRPGDRTHPYSCGSCRRNWERGHVLRPHRRWLEGRW